MKDLVSQFPPTFERARGARPAYTANPRRHDESDSPGASPFFSARRMRVLSQQGNLEPSATYENKHRRPMPLLKPHANC